MIDVASGKMPLITQVLDRVGVDVDAIHRVGRAGGDVVVQAERRQVLEQPPAQVVHHPLAGIDLHLRGVGRDELIDDLQHHARDTTMRSGGRGDRRCEWRAASRRTARESVSAAGRSRSRWPAATVAARPGRSRPGAGPTETPHEPVRLQERQRPGEQADIRPAFASGSGVRSVGPGAIRPFGIGSGTIRLSLESATYSHPRRGANATRVGAPNAIRPSCVRSRIIAVGPDRATRWL